MPRFFKLFGIEHLGAHHETHCAAGVHHIAPNAPVQVLLAGNGAQHLTGQCIGDHFGQHQLTGFFEFVVNALERVCRVFGVGIKEFEQHIFVVFNQARRAACAHAQQAKHRHVFVMYGEQNATAFERLVLLVDDESHPHRAGLVLVCDQKVAANVQLTVVFFIKARRFFDVFVHRVFGNEHAKVLVDPALFFQGGGLEVNPDGLKARQLFQRLDFFLEQAPIGKGKDVEHGKGWRRSPGFEGIEGMAAFEPLAARPVQAHPLREEIRKLPTGVGFQGVRSVFVQL